MLVFRAGFSAERACRSRQGNLSVVSHLIQLLALCNLERRNVFLPESETGHCNEVLDTLRAHAALRLFFRRPLGHNAAMSLLAVLANCLI